MNFRVPPHVQKYYLSVTIIYATLVVFMCIFMFKNCFKQHLQTKVRFIILCIYHIIYCLFHSLALIDYISGDDTASINFILPEVQHVILHLSLVLVNSAEPVEGSKIANNYWNSMEKAEYTPSIHNYLEKV